MEEAEMGDPGCAAKGLLIVVVFGKVDSKVFGADAFPRTRFSKSVAEVAILGERGSPMGPDDMRSVVGERKPFG